MELVSMTNSSDKFRMKPTVDGSTEFTCPDNGVLNLREYTGNLGMEFD